ncbi:MAG: thiamine-phosphate kinase [Chloroflexota bacterium]|nr:thiamine-phosphate kinase [Chloroflexota bacterium]
MKVSELGEFPLIDLLAGVLGPARGEVVVGIGDDAAAWRCGDSSILLTTDCLVQDVHFRLKDISFRELGWKALAVNTSDIAAMGGQPQYAVVSLCLPGDIESEAMTELYRGLAEHAREFGIQVVGGNVSAAPVLMVSVALVGQGGKRLLLRSAARPGDQVAVTGQLGGAAAWLRMLDEGLALDKKAANALRRAHLRPQSRVKEGQALVERGVLAAIDISDGLVADLGHVCQASGVQARIRANLVPVHPVVKQTFPQDWLRLALAGGEDYELLFTAPAQVMSGLDKGLGCPVTVVGDVLSGEPGRVTVVDSASKEIAWDKGGWQHFATGR